MTGSLEILVKPNESDEFKYSKGIDESTFFGLKKYFNEERSDYARVVSEKVELI